MTNASRSTHGASRTLWTVEAAEAGLRLDKFLAAPERLASRAKAIEAIDRGRVFVNEREATGDDAGKPVRRGDVVRLWLDRPGSAARRRASRVGDLRIVYEDAALLVVDKPAGLLSVPLAGRRDASSAFEQLAAHFDPRGRREPQVVHRIDRDTSGLLVFAKTADARQRLKAQFERRQPERVYLAFVHGVPSPARGTWRDRLAWDQEARRQTYAADDDPGAKEAVSHYRVVERYAGAALIEVRLETGKWNQIRVQAAAHGHPLIGERQYAGDREVAEEAPMAFARQALHAHRLGFRHPIDGRPLLFESPLPRDLASLRARLRGANSELSAGATSARQSRPRSRRRLPSTRRPSR